MIGNIPNNEDFSILIEFLMDPLVGLIFLEIGPYVNCLIKFPKKIFAQSLKISVLDLTT